MWRDALLVAAKDLRIEMRSRVVTTQVLPFAGLVLVLFAFALDGDPVVLRQVGGGLFWVAVLFSAVLAVQRSFGIEASDAAGESLRSAGLDAAGIFVGKAAAIAIQLVILEVVLSVAVTLMYHLHLAGVGVLLGSAVLATIGLAAAGTLYGSLASTTKVRETLLPILFLPIVSPVLLAATRAWQFGISGDSSQSAPWLGLLGIFAAVYGVAGVFAFGPIMEQA